MPSSLPSPSPAPRVAGLPDPGQDGPGGGSSASASSNNSGNDSGNDSTSDSGHAVGNTAGLAAAEHSPPAFAPPPGRVAVACRRLRPEAVLPAYQSAGAAGMDLRACLASGETVTLAPLARALLPTGLALAIPPGFEGQVRPRSGWALKEGVTILNSPGTIDSDYRGEVRVLLINLGQEQVTIAAGERIAQLVICAVAPAQLHEVELLDQTCRGAGGFGHTGRG